MNIREFISYKKLCPLCNQPNKIVFHSVRKQLTHANEYKLLAYFNLKEITKRSKLSDYKICFSVDLDTNQWCVDLCHGNIAFDSISFLNLNKIKKLIINLNNVSFSIRLFCKNKKCLNYDYSSPPFKLNMKNPFIENFLDLKECFRIYDKNVLYICNNYMNSYTLIEIINDDFARTSLYKLPYVPFLNKEHYISRINKLITFL